MLFILTRAGEQEVGGPNKTYFWVGNGVLSKEIVFPDCKMSIHIVSPMGERNYEERHMLFILTRAEEQEVGQLTRQTLLGNGVTYSVKYLVNSSHFLFSSPR